MQFSIVVPVYLVEPYLNQCLDHIRLQSFQDYEVILVDDGSPDGCPQICDDYASRDPRFRVIHQDNCGLATARNVGIRAAKGEFILLVDSDDFWPEADMLRHLEELIHAKEADVLLFRVKAWEETQNKSRVKNLPFRFDILDRFDHDLTLHYLLSGRQFPVGVYAMCVSRQLLLEKRISFQDGAKSEDYDWILSVLRDSSRISATDRVLYVYRMGRPESITHKIDLLHLNDLLRTASRWSAAPGFSDPGVRRDVSDYAAYLYSTALVVTGGFPKAQRRQAVKLLKQHRNAVRGARRMSLRLIRLSLRILGVWLTAVSLHTMYNLKLRKELK